MEQREQFIKKDVMPLKQVHW